MHPTLYKNLHQLWQQIMIHFFNPMSFSSLTISLSLSLFFFFLLPLKLIFNSTKNSTKTLPPSPPRLPIIGNLHQLGSLPHRSVASLSEKYGPLMLFKLGQTPTLVVSSAKLAREVMKYQGTIFCNRTQNTAAKALFYGCHDVAFASYGERWRQASKVCVLELLSAKRVESFQHIRDEEVAVGLVNKLRKATCSSSSLNLNQLLMSTSSNIASRCVLGEKFEDENGNTIFGEVTRKAMMLLTTFCVGDAFPWLLWVDVLRGFHRELRSTFETLDAHFEKVIEEHKEKMKIKKSGEQDFVGIMLQLQQDDALDYRFTMDDLKAILLVLFL